MQPRISIITPGVKNLDKINTTYGKNSIYIAAEKVHNKWAMRQAYRSPSYTSRWDELAMINCQ